MKVGIKGHGGHIKWIDPNDILLGEITLGSYLEKTEKLLTEHEQKFKLLETKLENVKLDNVQIVKGLISR